MNDKQVKEYDFHDIKKKLQKDLETKRYEHTIGVADISFALALRYGYDPEKAYLAGLLHDCAKCFDNEKKFSLCKKYNVELSQVEKENPYLIHAKLGAAVAREKYGIEDDDVLNAITYHTTGKPDMNLLEKIVFSADYIEPGRKMILGLKEIRETIFNDFDMAVYLILKNTLLHLEHKEQTIDMSTADAFEFYKNLIENR